MFIIIGAYSWGCVSNYLVISTSNSVIVLKLVDSYRRVSTAVG